MDWDSTQNIFIEGDNLEVLKLLQKSYHKKVKMIYIDPPYNTGKDFVYKDNFKDNIKNYKEITGQVDGEGRNLSNNPETSGRYHTDWLNMMYPRLKLARNLLKDDGVIFISIDDNEATNLRNMCNEIFGEENFLSSISWKKRSSPDARATIGSIHDWILCYLKNGDAPKTAISKMPLSENRKAAFANPDNDSRGPWASVDMTGMIGRATKEQFFEVTLPSGRVITPPEGRSWGIAPATFKQLLAENRIWFGVSGDNVPRIKKFLSESEGQVVPSHWDMSEVGSNDEASKEVTDFLKIPKLFDTPKPTRLVKRMLEIGTEPDDLILDFFAGSATTAHAVMKLNAEDGGNRKFIMVQLPETTYEKSEAYKAGYKTIAEISKERIRRAGKQLKMDNEKLRMKEKEENSLFSTQNSQSGEAANSQLTTLNSQLDTGFRVFKLDSTNIKPWEVDFDLTERTLEDFISNIKPDRREEDVLYEVLLKYGLSLDLPIEKWRVESSELRVVNSEFAEEKTLNSPFSTLYSIGFCALVICLDDNITLETVEAITKLKEKQKPEIMRVVFKDSGFKDDVVKTNAVQILKQAGIVDVRSL